MGIYPPTSLGTPIPGLLSPLAPERLILARENQRRSPLLGEGARRFVLEGSCVQLPRLSNYELLMPPRAIL